MKAYLANPYSHPQKNIEQSRFEMASYATATLISRGINVFSPIAYSHPLATQYKLGLDFEYWQDFNRSLIDWADCLLVLMLDGWNDSRGVVGEVNYAINKGKRIFYASMSDVLEGKNLFED